MECSWEELYKFIKEKANDLDLLIQAHDRYLDTILNNAMLNISPTQNLLDHLDHIFGHILEACRIQASWLIYILQVAHVEW
jgi:hypothetical protein